MDLCEEVAGAERLREERTHVRLGDIVVSNWKGVIQYDMTNLNEIDANPRPPSALLTEAVEFLEVEAIEGKFPWEPRINEVLEKHEKMYAQETARAGT